MSCESARQPLPLRIRQKDCLHFISRTLLSLHAKSFCSPRHRRVVCKMLTYAVPFWMPRSSSSTTTATAVANGERNCAVTHSNNGNEFSGEQRGSICSQCDAIDVIVYRSVAKAYVFETNGSILFLFRRCSSLANIYCTRAPKQTPIRSLRANHSCSLPNCLFIFAKINLTQI